MNCANCGKEIAEYSNFCYYCGSRQYAGAGPSARPAGGPRKLYRSRSNRSMAGVLGGFAEYLDIDPTVLRVIFVLIAFFTGIIPGVIAYVVAWFVMSEEPVGEYATYAPARAPAVPGQPRRLTRSVADRKWAGVCGGLGEYLDVDSTVVRIIWVVLSIVPGTIIGGLFVYLLAWMIMPEGTRMAAEQQASGQPIPHSS